MLLSAINEEHLPLNIDINLLKLFFLLNWIETMLEEPLAIWR